MKKTFLTVAFSIILIVLSVSILLLSIKIHRQQREIHDLVLLSASDIGINEIRNIEGASVKTSVAVGPMKEKIDDLEPVNEILEILRNSVYQKAKEPEKEHKPNPGSGATWLTLTTKDGEFTLGSKGKLFYFRIGNETNYYICSNKAQFYTKLVEIMDMINGRGSYNG